MVLQKEAVHDEALTTTFAQASEKAIRTSTSLKMGMFFSQHKAKASESTDTLATDGTQDLKAAPGSQMSSVIATAKAARKFQRIISEMDDRRDVVQDKRRNSTMGLDRLRQSKETQQTMEVDHDIITAREVQHAEWSEFQNIDPVGVGAFCEVYVAQWRGDSVAVKLLKTMHVQNQMAIDDVHGEVELMGSLEHPHILRVLGVGEVQDRPFIVMEKLHGILTKKLPGPRVGTPIWERARACKLWTPAYAADKALQLAMALKYLHEDAIPSSSVLHRDLKPDNIGFASDDRLVLFDFGLAKVIPKNKNEAAAVEMTGEVGSTRYMAPEVCLSKPYGTAAEVCSWALIFWQMLSHDRPFEDMDVASHKKYVAQDGVRPSINKKWPEPLRNLLPMCWDEDPAKRPSFAQIVPRLEHYSAPLGLKTLPPSKTAAALAPASTKKLPSTSAPGKESKRKKFLGCF